MNFAQIDSIISTGKKINDEVGEEILESLVVFYEKTLNTNDKELHNDFEAIDLIIEDMARLGQLIPSVGHAKAISDTLLDNRLSNSDYKWRLSDLKDYKLSSKSSTIHATNLKGRDDNIAYAHISKLLTNLYFDLNKKLEALRSVVASIKFGIENQLWEPVIRKSHGK